MASNASFDITTGVDLQEVDNAVNQTRKELGTRFDFRGVPVEVDYSRSDARITLHGPDDHKIRAMLDVLQTKLIKRGVPLKNLDEGDVETVGGGAKKQVFQIKQTIDTETAKKIVKFIKDKKFKKITASIQKEQVRVTSPSRDDLQSVIGALKTEDFGVELQFGNYR